MTQRGVACKGKLARRTFRAESLQISVSNAEAKVGPPVFNVVPMPGLKHTKEDISRFSAPVKSVTQLLSGATAARSTVRVVIDLSDLPYLQYCPGDHLVAYAANDAEVRACTRLRLPFTTRTLLCSMPAELQI